MKSPVTTRTTRRTRQNHALSSLVVLLAMASNYRVVDAFGLVGKTSSKNTLVPRHMTENDALADFAKAAYGEVYAEKDVTEGMVDDMDDLLVSASKRLSSQQDWNKDTDTVEETSLPRASESEAISPFAPPLTYRKFLTMQSKRVPVTIRYSTESGMKPYFLTVAKKIKDAHTDIILDKVLLPKVEGNTGGAEGKMEIPRPVFEVLVDGKVIIPFGGKKERVGSMNDIVFVSMQELEVAISRARKRRRPSSVYGEDESNVRLEMIKAKAALQTMDQSSDL